MVLNLAKLMVAQGPADESCCKMWIRSWNRDPREMAVSFIKKKVVK